MRLNDFKMADTAVGSAFSGNLAGGYVDRAFFKLLIFFLGVSQVFEFQAPPFGNVLSLDEIPILLFSSYLAIKKISYRKNYILLYFFLDVIPRKYQQVLLLRQLLRIHLTRFSLRPHNY